MSTVSTWPAVSVVVTCYNLEAYIGPAVRSVLAQDYAGPVEVIVIDDASTDGSIAVLSGFHGVHLVERTINGGVLLAMLDGIDRASHDLIFLLDGDDIWEADKLRRCVERFIHDPTLGFVTHSLTYVDGSGAAIDRPNRVEQGLSSIDRAAMSDYLRRSIQTMRDDVWLGSAMAFRRSMIDVNGFAKIASQLPDPGHCYQDWPLAYWIAAQPRVTLGYVPERLFRYRLHGANHSGDAGSAERAERNFRRAANTIEAMVSIGEQMGVAEGLDALRERVRANRYLADLYRERSLASIARYAGLLPFFRRSGVALKEAVRLAGVLSLGPDRFARLAARRRAAG